MKKSLITLSILSLTSLTFTAQAQTVLTVSSWVPPTHGLSVAQKEWCDALTSKTANRVRCNILPRAVTPAPGTFDAVKNGLVDVSFTVHGYTPGRFVLTQMAEFPFLGDRAEPLSVAFNRIASKHPEFAEGWLIHGLVLQENNQLPEAEKRLEQYVQRVAQSKSPEHQAGLAEALMSLAQIAQKNGQLERAKQWLAQMLTRRKAGERRAHDAQVHGNAMPIH